MTLKIDSQRGKKVARLLRRCLATDGILGQTEMPEQALPKTMQRGSLEHLLFITLTVAIDYQRDAAALWSVARKTFEDPHTRYLFDPELLHLTAPHKIFNDMQKHGLSKKPKKDAHIWRTIGVTFYKKWKGDPVGFLEDCGWNSLNILSRLKGDSHLYNGKSVADYPYLRGNKIGPLWLRMLRDNAGIKKLKNLDAVPIPVDIHVARATLALGVVKGRYKGDLKQLFENIRVAWFESVQGLKMENRSMIALDVDEPLWQLSRCGCTKRDKENGLCPVINNCEAKHFCIRGKIKIENNPVELNT